MRAMHVPTQRVVRSSMQLVRQHNPKLACATSLQATITRASCSATTRSNVLEWVLKVSWAVAPIDVSLTWIRWYKEAEQARINQMKFDIDIKEDNID